MKTKLLKIIGGGVIIIVLSIVVISLKWPRNVSVQRLITQETPTRGLETATVSLVEFANYECIPCASYVPVLNDLVSLYDARLTIAYRHVSLSQLPAGTDAAWAAEAARLQGKFWEFSNALFLNQQRLGYPLYMEIVKQLKLNLVQFEENRLNPVVKRRVEQDTKLAKQIGATNLPQFYLNGKRLPHMSPQELKKAVENVLPTPTPTPIKTDFQSTLQP